MSLKTLFSNQATDGNSSAISVAHDEDNPGIARIVSVQGKWNGGAATIKLQSSNNPEDGSPSWSTIQYLNNGTLTDLQFTADFIMNVHLTPGAGLRAVQSDSGSPAPSVTVTALGHLNTVA